MSVEHMVTNQMRRRTPSAESVASPKPARLVFMGGGRVGTSSIINRFTQGSFRDSYKPERAKVMRHNKQVTCPKLGCDVTVQLWDVEGGDMPTALVCAKKAHAVAVVYDVTNRSSFEMAQRYLDEINPRASSLLIGNKCDLERYRKVSVEEGRLLARIHKVKYIEVSAKESVHIGETFVKLVDCVPKEYLVQCKGQVKDRAARRWRVTGAAVCAVCQNKFGQDGHDKKGVNSHS